MDCEYCKPPFKHCGKYYISTGYDSDPYLYTIRKEDSFGGAMIKYCPWCGRKFESQIANDKSHCDTCLFKHFIGVVLPQCEWYRKNVTFGNKSADECPYYRLYEPIK